MYSNLFIKKKKTKVVNIFLVFGGK